MPTQNILFCFSKQSSLFCFVSQEEGCEDAFEAQYEVQERVSTGRWIGDCFVYVNGNDRLNYVVGGEVQTMQHLDP